MDRTVEFLLNNYYYKDNKTEKLAKGELWSTEHAVKNMREQRTYERLNKLETIITNMHGNFTMTKKQKDRARHQILYPPLLISSLLFYCGQGNSRSLISIHC